MICAKKFGFLLAAAALLTAPMGLSAAAPEHVLKLEQYRKGVAVRVSASGQQGLFVIDTAGGITIVSPAFAKRVGCKEWGTLVGHQMTGNKLSTPRCDNFRFSVQGAQLTAPVAGVLDVAPLISRDAEPVDGLLALDVFDGKAISIDAAAGTLTVETPQSLSARIVRAQEVPVKLARELGGRALAVFVQARTSRGPVGLEIDTGNGGTILVSKAYASDLGLKASDKPQQGQFEIAPGIIAKGVIFTPELTIDGNLGMPFLKDWIVTLDLKAGRMWLKRSAVSPPKGMGEPPPLPKS